MTMSSSALPEKPHVPLYSYLHIKQNFESCPIIATNGTSRGVNVHIKLFSSLASRIIHRLRDPLRRTQLSASSSRFFSSPSLKSATMFAVTGALLLVIGAIAAQPLATETNSVENAKETSIWKDTPMDTVVQEFRAECLQQSDSAACIKVKVLNLLDDVLRKDSNKVTDGVSLVPNENQVKEKTSARSSQGFLDQMESYIKGHDLVVKTPAGLMQGATFKLSPRNLDENEINMSVKLPSEDDSETFTERGRKSKLKKILVPILVFVLLKAMTLIPLAIGVLGLKAWNALQLSFISFLVSISLAIFQLCKKVAAESQSGIAAHIPFETSHYAAARNFVVDQQRNVVQNVADINDPQNLAYRAYAQAQVS